MEKLDQEVHTKEEHEETAREDANTKPLSEDLHRDLEAAYKKGEQRAETTYRKSICKN